MIKVDDSYKVCFDTTLIDVNEWKAFIEHHPESNIFHTPEFYLSFTAYSNYKPTPVFILNKKHAICGIIMLIAYSERQNFIGKITTRAISFDFPLVPKEINLRKVIDIIKSRFSIKLVHWNLILFKESETLKKKLLHAGFVFEPHLNFIFDLSVGEKALLVMISKTRRKQIRRAEKRGVVIYILKEKPDFSHHYKILSQTYKEANLPLFDIDYFTNLINGLRNKQLLIVEARVETKIIGFRMVLLHKCYMYDFFAGSDKNYSYYYPNDLLVWETLKYGSNNGFTVFNFGGAGHPDKKYGVREFKKSFGGKLIKSGIYRIPINKVSYTIFRLIKKLRSSL